MARTWMLRTETKGTGAQMVPLEDAPPRSPDPARVFVRRRPRPAARIEAPAPQAARRFRVVDMVSGQTLADRVDTRATIETLKSVRSPVDVNVYVWREQPGRWRLLTLEEKRTLWDLRDA
jgi:hypothetical protein